MTRYTVVWHEVAQNQLAEIWLNAAHRQSVAYAANAIDTQLAQNANSQGIEVEGGLRQDVVSPLRVLMAVSEPDRLARILEVSKS